MSLHKDFSILPKRLRVVELPLLLVMPFFMLLLLEGYSRGSFANAWIWVAQYPLLALLNYMLFLCPCLLLGGLRSDRTRAIVALLFCLFFALLGIANGYKILYRMEPVLFSDVTQLGDAAATLTKLDFDIDVGQITWLCVGFLVAAILCFLFMRGKQEKRPILWPALGVALLLVLPPCYTFELVNGGVRTDMVDRAMCEGTLYAAIAMENHRNAIMRLEYNEQEVRAGYNELVGDMVREDAQNAGIAVAKNAGKQPNIILVLAESFTDDRFLGRYLHFNKPNMPFYDALREKSLSGFLRVPKVGGGTSETEFEVLTGMSSRYEINPYSLGLPPLNSLASVLAKKGYATTVLHWYSGVYYNRYHNLKMLGFDSFYTTDTTTTAFEKKGMFTSDAEHYRSIMKQLRSTSERDFVFCLTMQNHGGYGYDDFRITYGATTPFSNKLSAEGEKLVTNYCYLLSQSDEALRAFVTELKGFEEPTLLVIFGDHIPPFGGTVYEELGIAINGEEGHMTPYLIWRNDEALEGEQNMKAYELGAYALTLAGLNDDPFLREVERLRVKRSDNKERYELLSYDQLFGKQYVYNEGSISPVNESFQIGGKMQLNGFDAAVIGDKVYLRPRLAIDDQAFLLLVDGQQSDERFVYKTDRPVTLQCKMTNSNGTPYNQSNAMVYTNTEELLQKSGELPYEKLPLWESEYELISEDGNQEVLMFRCIKPYQVGNNTAATLGGETMSRQPTYGMTKALEYSVSSDGVFTICVNRNALKEQNEEGLRKYLEQNEAYLYAFED